MSDTIRERVSKALVAKLAELDDFVTQARNANFVWRQVQLPALVLVDGADVPNQERSGGGAVGVDQMFATAIAAEAEAGLIGQVLNELAGQVQLVLGDALVVEGLAFNVRWDGTSEPIPLDDEESDPEHALIIVEWAVERQQSERNPYEWGL